MEKQTVTTTLYSQFLIASEGNITATRLEEITIDRGLHDRITKWLRKSKLTPGMLWEQVSPLVNTKGGWFILDDSVLDKPFGPHISLSCWQYSGTHHEVVHGLGLITLLWTNGVIAVPVNFRLYDKKTDGKTKHRHAQEMLLWAKGYGFTVGCVCMDSWYSCLKTLQVIQRCGWHWLTEFRSNRKVFPAHGKPRSLRDLAFPDKEGKQSILVHLKGVGYVRVARTESHQNGSARYRVTNDLSLVDLGLAYAQRWEIETYHRELKQTVNIARCQARAGRSQRNHIFCSLLAYAALQVSRITTGLSAYQTKLAILAPAIRNFITHPTVSLPFIP